MTHVDVNIITPDHAQRVIDLERQQHVMLGREKEVIDAALPDVDVLAEDIRHNPENFLGAFIASRLVGFSVVAPWTPSDDALFMDRPKDIKMAKIRSAMAGYVIPFPIGIHSLAIDSQLSSVEHSHATHYMVATITGIADTLDREVHATVQQPLQNLTLDHLRRHNFNATTYGIISPQDGTVLAAKFVRPRRSRTGGKTIRSTQSRLGFSPVARFG